MTFENSDSRKLARGLKVFPRLISMAVSALWAFKLRSAFVAGAVGLGVASLTLIVASVDGAQKKAVEIAEWFGPDAAFILGGDIRTRAVGQRTLTLSKTDAARLAQSLPGAYLVVGMRAKRQVVLKYGGESVELPVVVGASENYASAWNWPLTEGRDLSKRDVALGAKVGLLGDKPARDLFGDESPVGKTVYVNDLPVQIIGRLQLRGISGGGGGGSVDERMIIPMSTLTQRFNLDRHYYRAVRVKFLDVENMDAHVENLRSFLRHLHKLKPGDDDDFTILTANEILKFIAMLKGGLVMFLGFTAGVAILVGGFVLANLFYLSVSERTSEIGLRKAMGATRLDITIQFLVEAVLLTLIGAAFGVVLGLGLGQTLTRAGILEIELSPKILVLAFSSAAAIGLMFGLRPARNAAGLDPIEALKS